MHNCSDKLTYDSCGSASAHHPGESFASHQQQRIMGAAVPCPEYTHTEQHAAPDGAVLCLLRCQSAFTPPDFSIYYTHAQVLVHEYV
jgi:hypothetical protein